MAGDRPEIILTETSGSLIEVDALAYPEDTYLVVDPYSDLVEPKTSADNLVAAIQTTLPRPLGEIITARVERVNAALVFRLVVLDFNRRGHCQRKTVEDTLRRMIWHAAQLEVGRLGLDRFEFLEPCLSAFRVLSCLCKQLRHVEAAGMRSPTTLMISLQKPSARRHYQVALANLSAVTNQ